MRKAWGDPHDVGPGVERKVFSEALANDALARITGTADLRGYGNGCDLVVEAIFEDRDAKAQLFARWTASFPSTTILTTNTSSFSITDLYHVGIASRTLHRPALTSTTQRRTACGRLSPSTHIARSVRCRARVLRAFRKGRITSARMPTASW
ncbi:MAG: hypothetical protein IPP83_11195 [Flavobacteriales bacterium]|nr:hypothetical protein [Flavobacteriales bacterium]